MPTEKQQFQNNLHGWMGVVLIGPKGDDRGGSVEPGGTVWLSEAEQVLTANAPRSAADNPFIAQMWPVADPETGEVKMVEITPLTPVAEGRFVPAQERFIPGAAAATFTGAQALSAAQVAATGPEPAVPTDESGSAARREAEVVAADAAVRPNHPPPAIPAAAARAAAAAEEERVRQEAAQTAAQGTPTRDPWSPPAQEPSVPPVPPQEPSMQTLSPPAAVGEEHAAKVDPAVGEETGAAPPPTGEPAEGSYTASEEVGTPQAAKAAKSAPPKAAQPPPFTPPKE